MRLLIDECLSIDLVSVAVQAGHDAQHLVRIGKVGWKDWSVARYAAEEGLVLVTNNAADFRRIYASQSLHAGLIVIIPSLNRVEQCAVFSEALAELMALGEPINQVLEVDIEGEQVVFALYDLPAT